MTLNKLAKGYRLVVVLEDFEYLNAYGRNPPRNLILVNNRRVTKPANNNKFRTTVIQMARSGLGACPNGPAAAESNKCAVGVSVCIGVGCTGVGLGSRAGVPVGVGTGSSGDTSPRTRCMANSRRFGSAGPSVKVRTSWLPA